MALNRWLAQRSEVELRRIVEEPMLWPSSLCTIDGKRCLLGSAVDALPSDVRSGGWADKTSARYLLAVSMVATVKFNVPGRFDRLCRRFGHVRITRLIQESALRHLARLAEQTAPALVR